MRTRIVGTLAVAAALVFGTSAATAATLTANLSATTVVEGGTITIGLTGDSEGASTAGIFVQFATDGGTFVNPNLNAVDGGWVASTAPSCDPQVCTLADAFAFSPVDEGFQDWGTVDLDTTGLAAGTVVSFVFTGDPNLNWYGLTTDQPAGTLTIVPIPEPTTAALLGLGLLGLGFAGRRRL